MNTGDTESGEFAQLSTNSPLSLHFFRLVSSMRLSKHHIIVSSVVFVLSCKSLCLQHQSQFDLGTHAVFDGRIGFPNHLQHLTAVQQISLLALLGFAETSLHNIANVRLAHVVQVQLLNPSHLLVVEPIRRLLLTLCVFHPHSGLEITKLVRSYEK